MQKFRFSLNTVLAYKQQIEDSLQSEYSAALSRVREQEETLEALRHPFGPPPLPDAFPPPVLEAA